MPKHYVMGLSPSEMDTFKRNYEFTKRVPTRSPAQGYEYNYAKEYSEGKEHNLVCGNPHKFKGVRAGNSYGKRKAMCRIPAKTNHGPRY